MGYCMGLYGGVRCCVVVSGVLFRWVGLYGGGWA